MNFNNIIYDIEVRGLQEFLLLPDHVPVEVSGSFVEAWYTCEFEQRKYGFKHAHITVPKAVVTINFKIERSWLKEEHLAYLESKGCEKSTHHIYNILTFDSTKIHKFDMKLCHDLTFGADGEMFADSAIVDLAYKNVDGKVKEILVKVF